MQKSLKCMKKMSSFKLIAQLKGETLIVTLQDYRDWTIYSEEFDDGDVGGCISKRVAPYDLYDSLASILQKESNQVNIEEISEGEQYQEYEFGEIIYCQEVPCFRIESGGKLTVFVFTFDYRHLSQRLFQSNLRLTKVRLMTETEIMNHLSEEQRKIFKNYCQQKFKQLLQQNKGYKTKLTEMQIKLAQKEQESKQKLANIQKQLDQTKRKLVQEQKQKEQYKANLQKLRDEHKKELERIRSENAYLNKECN